MLAIGKLKNKGQQTQFTNAYMTCKSKSCGVKGGTPVEYLFRDATNAYDPYGGQDYFEPSTAKTSAVGKSKWSAKFNPDSGLSLDHVIPYNTIKSFVSAMVYQKDWSAIKEFVEFITTPDPNAYVWNETGTN